MNWKVIVEIPKGSLSWRLWGLRLEKQGRVLLPSLAPWGLGLPLGHEGTSVGTLSLRESSWKMFPTDRGGEHELPKPLPHSALCHFSPLYTVHLSSARSCCKDWAFPQLHKWSWQGSGQHTCCLPAIRKRCTLWRLHYWKASRALGRPGGDQSQLLPPCARTLVQGPMTDTSTSIAARAVLRARTSYKL